MWKIETCALGILVFVLASPEAIGQEKPKVRAKKSGIEKPVKAQTLQDLLKDVQRQAQLDRAIQNFEAQVRVNGQNPFACGPNGRPPACCHRRFVFSLKAKVEFPLPSCCQNWVRASTMSA